MPENVPFGILEDFELGDMSEVKEDRLVLPPASHVLFRIQKVTGRSSTEENAQKYGATKALSVEFRLVEGIEVPKKDGAGTEVKFQNKPFFEEFTYWVDTSHPKRQSERYTGKHRSFLNPLKQLLLALGYDVKAMPTINDALVTAMQGCEVRANIVVKKIQVPDETGTWVDTGETKNILKHYTPA